MDVRAAIASLAAGGLLLGACGGPAVPADSRRIDVEMRSFTFAPASVRLTPGEKVTIVLTNPDSVEHEFMAGREPLKDGGFKDDLLARLDAQPRPTAGHGEGHGSGVAIMVPPSGTRALTFVVPADSGAFEFACFLPGHYEGGMKGSLSIAIPNVPGAPAGAPTTAPQGSPGRTAPPTPTDEHAGEGH